MNFNVKENFDKNNQIPFGKGDRLESEGMSYWVEEEVGKGTYGTVFSCMSQNGRVALKVFKSGKAYQDHGVGEYKILASIPKGKNVVEVLDLFFVRDRLCIVTELLDINLYDMLRARNMVGVDAGYLRSISKQVLDGMVCISSLGIIHCDLKPENILFVDSSLKRVKIIDFSSSSTSAVNMTFYAQSRYYRAPEVLLGIPYGSSIDMWSFGCVVYELFVGVPLFQGKDNISQFRLISSVLGEMPHPFVLQRTKFFPVFYDKLEEEKNRKDIYSTILNLAQDVTTGTNIYDFIFSMVDLHPFHRLTPQEALTHPFIRQKPKINTQTLQNTRKTQQRDTTHTKPVPNDGRRRKSVVDNITFEEIKKPMQRIRKGSVYDWERGENKKNK